MNRSLKLFSIKGIDIRLHITFPLILLWAAFQFGQMFSSISGALFGVVAITILFALVTLHELGHSFAAMSYGIPVKQIILSPIGGVAQLTRMPDKPVHELVVAIAGPAVNILMAILMLAVAVALGIDFGALISGFTGLTGATLMALFSYVFISNIFLAIFNLIPAFPMDGGRILRALMAMRLEYARATKLAATVGRGFAVLFGMYGLLNGNLFMIFIAIFIYGAGTQEVRMSALKQVLRGHTVEQAFSSTTYRLEPSYTLQQAANMAAYSGQSSFAIVSGDKLVGFLPQEELQKALRTHPTYTPVSEVMLTGIRPVKPSSDLYMVQERMQEERLDALPVVSEIGRFLGTISRHQIAELFRVVKSQPPIITGSQSA
jgi:stage IV sporulation protein FB